MPTTLDPIQAYIEQLFVTAGLDNLPSDIKDEYSERLGVEVNRRIGLAMMDSMDEKSLGEFNTLMEKDEVTPDDARGFFFRPRSGLRGQDAEGFRGFRQGVRGFRGAAEE